MKSKTLVVLSLVAAVLCMMAAYQSVRSELPSFVTAKARVACEPDVRRLCRVQDASYNNIRACIKTNWRRLSSDCQYEIVSVMPQIEAYEKRRAKKK